MIMIMPMGELVGLYLCTCGQSIRIYQQQLLGSGTWILDTWHQGQMLVRWDVDGGTARDIAVKIIYEMQRWFILDKAFLGCEWNAEI